MGDGNYNTNQPGAKESAETAGGGFLAGAIIGSILGATLAVLYTPKAGKEVRGKLTESSQGLNSKVKNFQNKRSSNPNSDAEEAAEEVARAIEEAADELEREEQTPPSGPNNI